MNPLLLVIGYLAVATLPLSVSWLVGGPPRSFTQELASGTGILAFAMILVEFVLSGRFKSISNGIGMDVTMRFHQMMARTALVFALVHPFLDGGAPTGGPRPWDPTRQLTVTTDFAALSSGIAAFLLLPALVLLAIYRTKMDYGYEVWRAMHGFGAVLIAGLLLHHATSAGRYGADPVMTWIWILLTGVAAVSLLYVYLLEPVLKSAKPWRVESVTQLTPRQWELSVAPDHHAGLAYSAGQFVWLSVGTNPFSFYENPFSISSAPASGSTVSFMIKELGDFTRTIGQIEPGTIAYIDGAFGNLTLDGRGESGVALIAGGIGIAPLMGILRQLRLTNDARPVKVLYGNRAIEQTTCREELDHEDVYYFLSEPPEDWEGETGLVSPDALDRIFTMEEIREWVFVVCGPAGMMEAIEDHLIRRGAPADHILSECFAYD